MSRTTTTLSPELTDWSSRGRVLDVFGRKVFALVEGPASAETLLVLHGFPTSSADFRHALPLLARGRRVVLHDHLGFGLSEKPARYSYSLLEQAEVAVAVWRELGITRGHLVAHDYGTSVATELLARRERGLLALDIRSLTLCNGSVHIELARPALSQHLLRSRLGPLFARLAGPRLFRWQLRRILGDPRSVPDAELDLMWEGLTLAEGRARLPQIAGYIGERTRFWDRWIGPLTRFDRPAHVFWGRRDPIARPAVAERLASEIPGSLLTWLPELGHYPMVEAPQRWAEGVVSFVDKAGSS
jgi:pimeloyl-ACP methyl ester carboxylesterase